MLHRSFTGMVVFFWLASMSWLVAAKIVPSLIGGDPPDYLADLKSEDALPDAWRIRWRDRSIGHAVSRVIRMPDGQAELRSVVHFEKLPGKEISQQLLGAMAFMARPLLGTNSDLDVELRVTTRTQFDESDRMTQVSTIVDIDDLKSLIQMNGTIDANNRLDVVAMLNSGSNRSDDGSGRHDENGAKFHQSFDLPPNTTLYDTLSRHGRLSKLRVGQSWTMPVYRGFPPNQPIQIIQASVTQHEIIFWEGDDVETLLVVYTPDPGSKIQAAREPVGRQWVSMDGLIVRQELSFAGLEFVFERMRDAEDCPLTSSLVDPQHTRLWKNFSRGELGDGGD
jgi:hypothetical protein